MDPGASGPRGGLAFSTSGACRGVRSCWHGAVSRPGAAHSPGARLLRRHGDSSPRAFTHAAAGPTSVRDQGAVEMLPFLCTL